MKTLIADYTFDASAQTVTFTQETSILLGRVLTVMNVTDGIVLYIPATPAKGGTVAANVLTLEYDTTSMADTDDLLIYYDTVDTPATSALQATGNTVLSALDSLLRQLNTALNRLGFLNTIIDTAGAARVSGTVAVSSLPTLANVTTVATVTTVTTVSTVTNQSQMGGYFTTMNVMAQINQGVAEGVRANITRS